MLELNRLAVLFSADLMALCIDLGELGVGVNLNIVLLDVLKQACSGLSDSIGDDISIMVTLQP